MTCNQKKKQGQTQGPGTSPQAAGRTPHHACPTGISYSVTSTHMWLSKDPVQGTPAPTRGLYKSNHSRKIGSRGLYPNAPGMLCSVSPPGDIGLRWGTAPRSGSRASAPRAHRCPPSPVAGHVWKQDVRGSEQAAEPRRPPTRPPASHYCASGWHQKAGDLVTAAKGRGAPRLRSACAYTHFSPSVNEVLPC